MELPSYKLLGQPHRQRSRGQLSRFFTQRFRLLSEKKVRSAPLQTTDIRKAHGRAVACVEAAIRKFLTATVPQFRYADCTYEQHVEHYCDSLAQDTRSPQHIGNVRRQLIAIGEACKFTDIRQITELPIRG